MFTAKSSTLHERPIFAITCTDGNKGNNTVKDVIYLIISVRNAVLQDKTIHNNKWLHTVIQLWLCTKLLPAYPASRLKKSNPPPVYRAEPGLQLRAAEYGT